MQGKTGIYHRESEEGIAMELVIVEVARLRMAGTNWTARHGSAIKPVNKGVTHTNVEYSCRVSTPTEKNVSLGRPLKLHKEKNKGRLLRESTQCRHGHCSSLVSFTKLGSYKNPSN
ncbi:hypothetical protein E2C01_049796 [Portunus trituberculatus]|uniref:Uncharacterized protein n=1 Tax=Portunus trituberculatus TaxID=210409 RepID=A0A5B7G7C3_PORTR|nr:hypothetical protein [Portunus trituberculatus]